MSGIKRKIEGNDPDYDDISLVQNSKRNKAAEHNAREAAVQKIEAIIREQFSLEMKNKEHEIDVISQRLNEARRMMDKLRACIVANYYANAGVTKLPEHASKSDPAVLNHPAIRRFLESPSRSSSPLNQGSETPSLAQSESESLSQQGEGADRDGEGAWREDGSRQERRPGRNTGKDTFGVPVALGSEQRVTYHTIGNEASRLYAKKTIVVGNVSRYIPPDKREENDQSTHKWMVYVRGSRREPSIDHFVKKVWFFLHPSYKPNDLVEVSEPPFHLTRRGWGEFPVRIQIHFKDPRNKRIDIIHQLKLDRTYTGLQTLGAETVVDVELHRNSLGEDYIPQPSSSKVTHRAASPTLVSSLAQSYGRSSSPISHDPSVDKGFIKAEMGRSTGGHSSSLTAGERTPTRPKASDRITLGSHGNSAFQPITASCKIVPQGQPPSPAESPGKSFQPITMSCKIVSGSPISTPSHSPLPRTPTTSTPVHSKQSSSSVLNNPYIIVDKPGQVIGMASSSAASAGSPSAKQSVAQGARSPAPKVHTGTFLSSGVKVIIKQEPGEVSTQQQQMVSTVTSQQQPAATAAHQFVAVKGGHMISMSAQKQAGGATGATTNKMLGIPVSSTLQSAVKQVAISSGQILVAKGNPSVSKVMGGKQVLAQGVAKAIVSGASGISGQQAAAKAAGGSSGKSGVMATLQLPANNLANLANLPPGTKLYLTTNSKNPSGKGKLLLIPQGAILRASSASQQSQSSTSAGAGGSQTSSSSSSSSSSLPSNLSYTSYILKQTPQGTFLVGQPAQGSGKQGGSSSGGHASTSPATVSQQAIRVTAGQKAAILAQVVGGSQGAQVKLSDGSVKTVTAAAAGHLSKPGTTTLRMTGGVITAASSTPGSVSAAASAAANQQQAADGGKSASQHHSLLVAANQAAVISAAKSASAAAGGSLSKTAVATLVKGAGNSATMSKSAAGSTGAVVTVAKGITNMPVVSMSKGAGVGSVVGAPKSSGTSLVTAASLVSGMAAGGGKTGATLSGMLKIHSGGSSSQQTVLTIPANQLKQLGVGTGSGGVQTILMPVGKVVSKGPVSSTPSSSSSTAPGAAGAGASPSPARQASPSLALPLAQVKTEPGASTAVTAGPSPPVTAPGPTSVHAATTVKQEQGADNSAHDLINTEHIETMMQLLTAVVKKFPLIVPDKTEDSHPFCASSTEQYYSWTIGKRRASELQRAVAVKRVVQDVLDRSPRLQALTPPKTREVVQWCRQRGYTPPDLEPQRKNDDESIEDILTQIDNEPECPTTLCSCEELVQRLEQMQALLKTEPEEADDQIVDIITVTPPCQKLKVKEEEQEADAEPKFFLGPCMSAQFVGETAQQIGVTFQPVEVEKNVFAPVVEAMILKATEQFASDILREALAGAYAKSPQNRAPREITAMNIHQAVSSVPTCDFLTNAHMGYLSKDN
ncbi:YEATS domain-containing protein 2 isoform X1 [Epinephelus moara]|uniref:YEATS domain-containing protein 2 isoform X1 n=1 Tax=Epinephelus moara TaxID=300413 RepID=UPI00214E6FEA|nr:YEATS domain-containing protein 2 isoform X1 [Epinephelus moara]XP_049888840.1 YEATS domain-containing protein 2 isoform X1 [Epinephelus moara]XP_049888841.1 YEATS domain-containing protein 2 isoform X1 [Epinephelus moara]